MTSEIEEWKVESAREILEAGDPDSREQLVNALPELLDLLMMSARWKEVTGTSEELGQMTCITREADFYEAVEAAVDALPQRIQKAAR